MALFCIISIRLLANEAAKSTNYNSFFLIFYNNKICFLCADLSFVFFLSLRLFLKMFVKLFFSSLLFFPFGVCSSFTCSSDSSLAKFGCQNWPFIILYSLRLPWWQIQQKFHWFLNLSFLYIVGRCHLFNEKLYTLWSISLLFDQSFSFDFCAV